MPYVRPGERIDHAEDCLLGHGTYSDKDTNGNTLAIASVAGEVQKIDRLITVQPSYPWYVPGVGDIVVGRITAIGNKRWYVDINAKLETVLMLTAINLEGNVQRRKGELDEIMMESYYALGDIIIAEVHSTGGKIQLHMRNENYQRVPFGVLLKHNQSQDIPHEQFVKNQEIITVFGKNRYTAVYGPSTAAREIKAHALSLLSNTP